LATARPGTCQANDLEVPVAKPPAKRKPRGSDKEGIKDSTKKEDMSRRDKRPAPLGPSGKTLDKAMGSGTIAPDPNTPSRTPKE